VGSGETGTVDWILPAVLVAVWLLLWLAGHRVRVWFLAIGVAVSILCIPAGFIAARPAADGGTCGPGDLCFSLQPVHWWRNGFFGLVSCLVLAVLTVLIGAVLALVRRARSQRHRALSEL
jgi:hypothetical protein